MKSQNEITIALGIAALLSFSGIIGSGCSKKATSVVGAAAQGTQRNSTAQASALAHMVPIPEAPNAPAELKALVNGSRASVSNAAPAPTSPGTPSPESPRAAAVVKRAVPVPPPAECFSVVYRHKKTPGHASDEDCSHHKNIIHLQHGNVNASAICVRVNGRPVAFQQVKGAPGDLLLGAVAGPDSKIVANYCVGKARCNDDCKIPRDEFMDAIGGGDEPAAKAGKWDASDAAGRDVASAKMDAEIRKEMAEIDAGADVFRDWLAEDVSVLACQGTAKQIHVVAQ